ncbi:triacylglycerol lipase [Peziza echinospora]|nr:triacylglycerol lipase [Peziza echinospora]
MAITPDELIKRQAIATRNDLINGLCAEIVIIYARGTSGEGNLGAALGPTFINQVAAAKPGKVIGQGVLPYAATVLGYLAGGDPTGANSMVTLIQRANTQCPGSKIVLGGYSQGAQVVHLAVGKLATTLYSKIAAIVTFGDPKRDEAFPTALQSKALVICNDGDLICDGLPIILGPHGAAEYEKRLSEAVSFVVSKV